MKKPVLECTFTPMAANMQAFGDPINTKEWVFIYTKTKTFIMENLETVLNTVKAAINITNQENILASFNLAEEAAKEPSMILIKNLFTMAIGAKTKSMALEKSSTMMKATMREIG